MSGGAQVDKRRTFRSRPSRVQDPCFGHASEGDGDFFHWIALYLGWQNPYQKVIVRDKTSHLAFVSAFNLFRIREIMRGTNYIICA